VTAPTQARPGSAMDKGARQTILVLKRNCRHWATRCLSLTLSHTTG
jgi:hypothetical protein